MPVRVSFKFNYEVGHIKFNPQFWIPSRFFNYEIPIGWRKFGFKLNAQLRFNSNSNQTQNSHSHNLNFVFTSLQIFQHCPSIDWMNKYMVRLMLLGSILSFSFKLNAQFKFNSNHKYISNSYYKSKWIHNSNSIQITN